MYVPAELPLSSYAAPPKMNDYLPKSASAYSYAPSAAAPAPYHPPGTSPMVGTPYHGAPAKSRAPVSPHVVENHSPQPYHQAQPSWAKPQQQQQHQQSAYQQDSQLHQQSAYKQDSQQQFQQTSTVHKSLYDQAKTSSGINTVRDMRSRFSGDNIAGQSQTLPRNFLSPSQQQPTWNGCNEASFDGSKVRNASPLPFGRHATTTNKSLYENSYTKTQFHNKLYQPPKGPLQHSFINNRNSSCSNASTAHNNNMYTSNHQQQFRNSAHYDTHPQQQPQQQYQASNQHETQNQQQQQSYNEHVSRSHFRSPAQPRQNPAPVFRNVTNFCFCR